MAVFQGFINAVSNMLGTDPTTGGMIVAAVFTIILIIMVLMMMKNPNPMIVMVMALMCSILFTVMGWYPAIVGGGISIAFAILFAWLVSQTAKV